jgi:3-oxoacyl-[acyl-carrier-protein] synthase-3
MMVGDRVPGVRIAGLGYSTPMRCVSSVEIEERIRKAAGRLPVPAGTVGAISGIYGRHVVGPDEFASTLAIAAGRRALDDAGFDAADIDLLVFASTSQDQVEPATAHIVADAMGIGGGSVFDVKNACNSFVDGIRVAEALVATGAVRRPLVVTGETPTLAARYAVHTMREFRRSFLGFRVGDAGGAVVLESSDDDRHIIETVNRSART